MKKRLSFLCVGMALLLMIGLTGCQSSSSAGGDFDTKLAEYAEVLVNTGLNVQKGETLVIICPAEQLEFSRLCTSAAYDAGAKEVIVEWYDNYIDHERLGRAEASVLDKLPENKKSSYNEYAKAGASFLMISSKNPDQNKGVDSERISRSSAANAKDLQLFSDLQLNNDIPWCIAAVPNKEWAEKVFPDLKGDKAVDALWDSIFDTVYVKGEGTAAKTWKEHIASLSDRTEKLNDYHFQYLHYTNELGTDLTVELSEESVWVSGAVATPEGKSFIPNMPTEEVFTAPKKDGVSGVVYSSLPLVLDGTTINNIKFVVEKGKIVSEEADEGVEILTAALNLDENARYFGEVSLVPYDSPISQSGILFYNTLFDENASCHLAFGGGYPESIRDGHSKSEAELSAAGLNNSSQHIDFMIGTKDLKIVGTTFDGKKIVIFENGKYAF